MPHRPELHAPHPRQTFISEGTNPSSSEGETSALCRFVCYSGDEMPVRPIVFGGSHTLVRQSYDAREMGHGIHNADGYGVGWYHGGRPVRIREARPIWHDPDLEDVLSSVRSTPGPTP